MKSLTSKRYCKSVFGMPLLACVGLVACGGGDDGNGGSQVPITVGISADQGTIQPGATAQVTATVGNDAANRGVTWTVSCPTTPCGTVSPSATASGAPTTYAAPTTRPPADLAVNITATAVSNTAVAASAKITVAGGIAISIAPPDITVVPAATSTSFTATVVNDPAKGGATWTLSCPAAPCGTVSPTTTASGAAISYTAPPTPLGSDLAVTLTATALSNGAVSAGVMFIVPGLTVSIETPPAPVKVPAGTSAQFTATVNNDPANKGVSWALLCGVTECGTVSVSTSASGTPVTYTAPSTAPPTDVLVTLTATSLTAPSVQGSVSVTVPAISIGITPPSALIPLNVTQPFTGTVTYDPTASGVTWALTQGGTPCPSACGALSAPITAAGVATTYTAPAILPASSTVTLTATSVTDPTKSATATVVLTVGSVKLIPTDLSFIKVKMKNRDCCIPPPQTARLTNTGNAALNISGIMIGGTNPTPFSQANTCGSSVTAGSSCDITVRFFTKPPGYYTALLSISDSSSDSPQQLHLTGTVEYQMTAAMRTTLGGQATAAVPPPSGSNRVGTRLMHLIDPRRADPYLATGMRRELLVRLWYPALPGTPCIAAEYTSPQVWNYFSTLLGVPLPQVSTHSCLNAPITAGLHPVLVFTHGFTGTFTDYTFLMEDLASRGYVVVSVNHTHEATAVEFPDGRLEKSVFGSHLTQYTRSDAGALAMAVSVRLGDLGFVLDELQRLNAGQDAGFAATLDLSRIALAGHSLGGLTTIRALGSEPRFKAGILLDAVIPPHLASPVRQPVLTLVAGRERWNEDDCRLWDALHGPRLAVNLPGAEHIALSDAAWLLRSNVSTGGGSPEAAIAAMRAYVASFLDANLAGTAPESVPVASAANYPGAVIATRGQSLCAQP